MTIGQRIKQRRIELNMSQEELAKKMGYSTRNAIYQFEKRDNMKLSIIEKFADALDTTPAFLMGWEGEKGDTTLYGQLVNAYVVNQKRDELFSIYEGLSPEKQATFEAYLKFLQAQP